MSKKPIIAIISCQKQVDGQPTQAVYQKYIEVVNHYGGNPILLPYTAAESDNFGDLMSLVDGILLTGSYSNVAPARYGATHIEEKQDLKRDELSFQLLKYAVEHDLPLLAICRGLQEMNVYFGGTLYPDWREAGIFFEQHLENSSAPISEQYKPVHDVIIANGGIMEAFEGASPDSKRHSGNDSGNGYEDESKTNTNTDVDIKEDHRWRVNSLHKQAIKQVAPDLFVEAKAPDELIEGISVPNRTFILGVQWHPEVNYVQDEMSRFLFSEFINHAKEKSQ